MSFKNPDKLKKKKPVYKKVAPKATPKTYDDSKTRPIKRKKTDEVSLNGIPETRNG